MARTKVSKTAYEESLAISEREVIKDWSVVNRLSAVIAYASNKAEDVAHVFGVTAETVIRWASRFHESGVDGLRDKTKGHRGKKLSSSNREIIRTWIQSGKNAKGKRVHWTLKRLCLDIKEHFNVEIGHSALAETLAEMKLVMKRPRPMHYSHDPQKAEEFKKKLLK